MLQLQLGLPVLHGPRRALADPAAGPRSRSRSRSQPSSGRVALLVAAALAAWPAVGAGTAVRVVAPDGGLDATARVACLEPASEPVAIDASGQALVPAGC